jgi:hypothetical protein
VRTVRPSKRSVSPFATPSEESTASLDNSTEDAYSQLEVRLEDRLGKPDLSQTPRVFKTPDDLRHLPARLRKIANSPANDAPELADLCHFLQLFSGFIEDNELGDSVYTAMQKLFNQKTELFMVDHHDRAHCERMGWAEEYRNIVLFSKERDLLAGRFFAPVTETRPGKFSEFVNRWAESENVDRLLHFLDFCAGSKNPTFEHALLFSHPALSRLIRDKDQLRSLLDKTQPLLRKLISPTWEKDIRIALGL